MTGLTAGVVGANCGGTIEVGIDSWVKLRRISIHHQVWHVLKIVVCSPCLPYRCDAGQPYFGLFLSQGWHDCHWHQKYRGRFEHRAGFLDHRDQSRLGDQVCLRDWTAVIVSNNLHLGEVEM